jgi:glycosyltransferase involved in cell wall biosynthesis
MKALVIDPALHSMGGHHYNAVLRLKTELSKLGVRYACLASAFADRDVVQELGALPCFTRSVYGRTGWTRRDFVESVAQARRQLSWGWCRQGRSADLLILPCCDQVLALALARHLRRPRLAPAPHVILWLLYAPHYKKPIDDPDVADLQDEYREAFAALRAAIGDDEKITVYCETPAMAQAYRDVVGLEIDVAPGSNLISADDAIGAIGERDHYRPPTVVCIGFANEPKGYCLLPDAVESILQARHDVRFLIHGVVQGSDAGTNAALFDALPKIGPRVTVSSEVLTHQAYLSWFRQADLVLLPYDREVYKTRGSGVFNEARSLGIPVVAPRGCDFAQPAFEEGWGAEIVDHSSKGVAQAVLGALDQIPDLTARAREAVARSAGSDIRSVLKRTIGKLRLPMRLRFAKFIHGLLRQA